MSRALRRFRAAVLLAHLAPAAAFAQAVVIGGTCASQDGSTAWTSTEQGCRDARGVFTPFGVTSSGTVVAQTLTVQKSETLATISMDGTIAVNWPAIEKAVADPKYPDKVNQAWARVLLAVRDGRAK